MRCQVEIDPRCVIDVGFRTPDRRMLVIENVRAIVRFLGEHLGHPPNAHRDPELQDDILVWEDENWRVSYRLQDSRNVLFLKRRQISIKSIYLKNVRE